LEKLVETKIKKLAMSLPEEALKEICNGYYFPVHDAKLDSLDIKWEMKMTL